VAHRRQPATSIQDTDIKRTIFPAAGFILIFFFSSFYCSCFCIKFNKNKKRQIPK
jgi:biotin transporter BioY